MPSDIRKSQLIVRSATCKHPYPLTLPNPPDIMKQNGPHEQLLLVRLLVMDQLADPMF